MTDRNQWSDLVKGKSPYWQQSWAEFAGHEAGLLVGDGVMAPVVMKYENGLLHVASPPGEVGIAPVPSDDDLLKPRKKPKPGRLIDALAELGASTAFLKEDPFEGEFEADMTTVDLAGSVVFDPFLFDPNVLPKNLRRTLQKTERFTAEVHHWSPMSETGFRLIAEQFCHAHCATVENGLTVERFMKLISSDQWRAAVVVVYGEDRVFAAGDVLLTWGKNAVNPFGATAARYRSESPAVKSMVATLQAAKRLGVRVLNVGGGIEPGDQLEWWKLRFGGRLISQRAVRIDLGWRGLEPWSVR